MRLFNLRGPKIKEDSTKKEGFGGWLKCEDCHEMIHADEMIDKLSCCPKCNFHFRLTLPERIKLLADEGTLKELFTEVQSADPLSFVDSESYPQRLERAERKSKRDEAVMVGHCKLDGRDVVLGVFDFNFMGGSMGSVVGERLTRGIEFATEFEIPLIIVSASGGARMQESIFSLMQMAKTATALTRLSEKGVLYISVLTHPTTGGVTASFASLGDVVIAEPGALIGFAGPRVVEQAMRKKLPPKAQQSEVLLERGMLDMIVARKDLKNKISFLINFLTNNSVPSIQSPEQKNISIKENSNKLNKILEEVVGNNE